MSRIVYFVGDETADQVTLIDCRCCTRRLIMSPRNRLRVLQAVRLRAPDPERGGAVLDVHLLPYERVELLDDDTPASTIRMVAQCAVTLTPQRTALMARRLGLAE